jgi:4-amino-4-deoxy-L-arabinose transferase-like glycosyltransferase
VIQTVSWVLNILFLVLALFALVDVLRRPTQAFPAVERQSKIAWALFTGISAAVIFIFGAVNFLGIIGVIVTMFYFVDVRPKVREISGSR